MDTESKYFPNRFLTFSEQVSATMTPEVTASVRRLTCLFGISGFVFNAVRQVAPSLVEKGESVYPYMGVSFDDEITLNEQSTLGLPQTQGAYVVSVAQGGPADAAGLIPASSKNPRSGGPTSGRGHPGACYGRARTNH